MTAAKCMGFELLERTATTVRLSVFGEQQTYTVLAINEFTSLRKRMSALVRRPDGSLCLLCKGADNVLLPCLEGCFTYVPVWRLPCVAASLRGGAPPLGAPHHAPLPRVRGASVGSALALHNRVGAVLVRVSMWP